jgi:small-conductance mechanosensitive channel
VEEFSRQFDVRHELVKRLHTRFREAGINIPFPIRTLYVPDGVRLESGDGADGGPGTVDANRGLA